MSRCLCTDCFSRIKDMRKLLCTEERYQHFGKRHRQNHGMPNPLSARKSHELPRLLACPNSIDDSPIGSSSCPHHLHHSSIPSEVEELTSRDLMAVFPGLVFASLPLDQIETRCSGKFPKESLITQNFSELNRLQSCTVI